MSTTAAAEEKDIDKELAKLREIVQTNNHVQKTVREITGGLRMGLTKLDDQNESPTHWLWPGRLPLGEVAVMGGPPGVGKSLVMLDLAARLSRGGPMPDGSPIPVPS